MLVSSKGILNIPELSSFLEQPIKYYHMHPKDAESCIAGWGRKESFFRAQQYSKKHNLELFCLEDGFIRSLGLGKDGYPPLSIVVDQSGIYFDSTQSSDLEKIISEDEVEEQNLRARNLINKIIKYQITKYNFKYSSLDSTLFLEKKNILVIDQTYGDQSIKYAGADEQSFKIMLQNAIEQHPNATIWVKVHPDVLAGKAKGHFDLTKFQHNDLRLCAEKYNPIALLQHMDEVYVVSSQLGFEALLCGKKVHCFGVPWYARWGLTIDNNAPIMILNDRRGISRSLEHLFVAAYLRYARYVSPISKQRCELEDIIDLLIVNITSFSQVADEAICYGFSRWKKGFIREFLQFPDVRLRFKKWTLPVKTETVFAWGGKSTNLKQQSYQHVWTVEDGFIRSSGLGANLIRPYSLVFDDLGIYYDATKLSRLEVILNLVNLDADQVYRSQKLIESINALNITKYNVGHRDKLQRNTVKTQKIILVTGQVEDDLSVQFGGVGVKTNLDLLKAVRKRNPNEYIIYKPHPDVHAGLRVGKLADEVIYQYANEIQLESSILECFQICDELHTISSLSGFEALLRGIRVHCYGLPFYAGWGLTFDIENCPRRKRVLTLTELVYGVLIQYASYNLPQTAAFRMARVNVEDVLEQLALERIQDVSSPVLKSTFAKIRAKIIYR